MLNKTNVIKIGYRKMPMPTVKGKKEVKTFSDFKYPINELRVPKGDLNDSMAVCEYTHYDMGKINSYLHSVIAKKFPDRKFALRKQLVKKKERVIVYRVK